MVVDRVVCLFVQNLFVWIISNIFESRQDSLVNDDQFRTILFHLCLAPPFLHMNYFEANSIYRIISSANISVCVPEREGWWWWWYC